MTVVRAGRTPIWITDKNTGQDAAVTDGRELVVTPYNSSGFQNFYGEESSVAGGSEVTIITYVVPVSKKYNISAIRVDADCNIVSRLYIDGVIVWRTKNSAAIPSVLEALPDSASIVAEAGQVIEIKALHNFSGVANISANLFGRLTGV